MLPLPLAVVVATLVPTIWIVDAANGPGTNFTGLPAAVAAAANGDTILVRAGTYQAFNVSGKALTIRGAGVVATTIQYVSGSTYPETSLLGVPAGSRFYLSGMTIGNASSGTPGMRIVGSGMVVLSDAAVVGANGNGGMTGLLLGGGAEVHVARSAVSGGSGVGGGAAVVVGGGSRLAADACVFNGGNSNIFYAVSGGAGLSVNGATATIARTSVLGGMGSLGGNGVTVLNGGFARLAETASNNVWAGYTSGGFGGGFSYALFVDSLSSAVVNGIPNVFGTWSGPVSAGPPLPYLSITGTAGPAGEILATQPVTVTWEGLSAFASYATVVDLAPAFPAGGNPLFLGEVLIPLPPAFSLTATLNVAGVAQTTLMPSVDAPALVGTPFYAQFGVLDSGSGQFRLSNGLVRIFN